MLDKLYDGQLESLKKVWSPKPPNAFESYGSPKTLRNMYFGAFGNILGRQTFSTYITDWAGSYYVIYEWGTGSYQSARDVSQQTHGGITFDTPDSSGGPDDRVQISSRALTF